MFSNIVMHGWAPLQLHWLRGWDLGDERDNFYIFIFSFRILTARIRRMGKVLFSQVCVCPHGGGGTRSPSHHTSTGPMSFPGGTPSSSHNTSTSPMSFLGYLISIPLYFYWSHILSGGTPSPSHNTSTGPMSFLGLPYLLPIPHDGVPPPANDGVPPWSEIRLPLGQGWSTYSPSQRWDTTWPEMGYPGVGWNQCTGTVLRNTND